MANHKSESPIRYLRMLAGMTQKNLADAMNVTQVTVWKWEKGESFPNVRSLPKLARVLNTTVADLIPDKEVS